MTVNVPDAFKPLAERMRPRTIAQILGQAHLTGAHRLQSCDSRRLAHRFPQKSDAYAALI